MRFRKRLGDVSTSNPAELITAREASRESRRKATEDLDKQRKLLAHESKTVTAPLRSERVHVNHFSSLIRDALGNGYQDRNRGEPA